VSRLADDGRATAAWGPGRQEWNGIHMLLRAGRYRFSQLALLTCAACDRPCSKDRWRRTDSTGSRPSAMHDPQVAAATLLQPAVRRGATRGWPHFSWADIALLTRALPPPPGPPRTVHMHQGIVDVKKKKGEVPAQPKNIMTSNPKKGHFGTQGTTLRCGRAGWVHGVSVASSRRRGGGVAQRLQAAAARPHYGFVIRWCVAAARRGGVYAQCVRPVRVYVSLRCVHTVRGSVCDFTVRGAAVRPYARRWDPAQTGGCACRRMH
jgi:hypothetical protein